MSKRKAAKGSAGSKQKQPRTSLYPALDDIDESQIIQVTKISRKTTSVLDKSSKPKQATIVSNELSIDDNDDSGDEVNVSNKPVITKDDVVASESKQRETTTRIGKKRTNEHKA